MEINKEYFTKLRLENDLRVLTERIDQLDFDDPKVQALIRLASEVRDGIAKDKSTSSQDYNGRSHEVEEFEI